MIHEWISPESATAFFTFLLATFTLYTIYVLIQHLSEFRKHTSLENRQHELHTRQLSLYNDLKYIELISTYNKMLSNTEFNQLKRILKINDDLQLTDFLNSLSRNETDILFISIRDYGIIFETMIPAIEKGIISPSQFSIYFGARIKELYNHKITLMAFSQIEFLDLHGNLQALCNFAKNHPVTTVNLPQ